MAHLHDVTITTNPGDFFKVYEGRYMMVNDTLIVYQLDHRVIDLLDGELKGKVNGINVLHVPIESGVSDYKQNCAELIKYIIFHQQNDIVKNNLFFANEKIEFHNAAIEACNENQRKITKNSYALFPIVDKACFNTGLCGYNFTIAYKDDFNRSWFGDEAQYTHPREEELMPIGVNCLTEEPYKSDGCYYEETEESKQQGEILTPEEYAEVIQFNRVWIHEKYVIPLKKYFSQSMGTFASGVCESTGSITIEHLVRPDEYMVIVD